jgi:nitroimidazol reductase NimA-like FMN-containing flavoprotein (pyridoxamine 5'-phosphate oxidase superfamily)
MEVNEIAIDECKTILERAGTGRLGCSYQDQPYVVPICFAYEDTYLYAFSTFGQKVKWMRANPKVCVQADQIQNQAEWTSVIVYGEYEELPEPQYAAERKHASSLLAKRHHWWLNALGQRQMRVSENSVQPLFFRIRIESMSGLRASERTQMTCSR